MISPSGDRRSPVDSLNRAAARATQELLDGKQLQQLLERSSNFYVGKVPEAITGTATPEELCTFFDTVVEEMCHSPIEPGERQVAPKFLHFSREVGGQAIHFQHHRLQSNSSIFLVTAKDITFILKIFNHKDEGDETYFDAAAPEAANGLYFNNRPTSNLSQLHFGNVRAGWHIYEYIGPGVSLEGRPGATLAEQGFEYDTYWGGDNVVNGVVVDHGGIVPSLKK